MINFEDFHDLARIRSGSQEAHHQQDNLQHFRTADGILQGVAGMFTGRREQAHRLIVRRGRTADGEFTCRIFAISRWRELPQGHPAGISNEWPPWSNYCRFDHAGGDASVLLTAPTPANALVQIECLYNSPPGDA